MPRRLLDQDRRREQRRQALLIERISRSSERMLAREIQKATIDTVKTWAASGNIAAPDDHQRNIFNILKRTWSTAITNMGGRLSDQAKARGCPIHTKAIDDQFFEQVQQYWLMTTGGEKIAEDIARTTVTQIMATVRAGRRQGLGQNEISEMINSRAAFIGHHRGAVIARTETHSAGNFGAMETAKATGLQMQKEWISAEDERTREAHIIADGQTVGLDEPFIVGDESLMHPGDMAHGSAGNVINCRCAQGFIVVD
jgi:uncharacterized protein with gpF-like domain